MKMENYIKEYNDWVIKQSYLQKDTGGLSPCEHSVHYPGLL